jgi:hypothetical protein
VEETTLGQNELVLLTLHRFMFFTMLTALVNNMVDPAIRLAPGHAFTVEPPPKNPTYSFIGHGVDMVPQVWPHAQCAVSSQIEVVGPTTLSDSGLLDPSGLKRPQLISIEYQGCRSKMPMLLSSRLFSISTLLPQLC